MRFSGITITAAICAAACAATLSLQVSAANVYDKDGTTLDVFGSVRAAYGNNAALSDLSHDPERNESSTVHASATLGLAGRSRIATGLDALMHAQWKTEGDGDLSRTEYLFAGLDAYQYGTLIAGRGDSAFYTVAGAVDIFESLNTSAGNHYFLGDQRPAQIMYSLSALSWDFRLSYQFARNDFADTPLYVHNGYAAAVSTRFGENVTFAYGVSRHNFTYGGNAARSIEFFAPMVAADRGGSLAQAEEYQRAAEIGSVTDYGVALSYGVMGQGFYGAAVFTASDYENVHHFMFSTDLAASYTTRNGLTVSAGYGLRRYGSLKIVSDLVLGVTYSFNQNFKVYAQGIKDLGGNADEFYTADYVKTRHLNEDRFLIGATLGF